MSYAESYEIESSARSLEQAIEEIDHQLTTFQMDLDSNNYMRESLDWDYMDVRKTLDLLLKQMRDLVLNAETAVKDEEDKDLDEDEEE